MDEKTTAGSKTNNKTTISVPSISLPKGGGAIRGIGEKFGANPVTGTGSMSVPIAVSPGRSGFGPQLSLSYDSGSGNGPFGFGWNLSLPSITRKTDKGIPQYHDAVDSDVFVLTGAEDLVPVLNKNAQGEWEKEHPPTQTVDNVTYRIECYRPRIEGLFARIERWTKIGDETEVFWRSISKENITTWYGRTKESRIVDPTEPSHIFSWLISQSHDDKGNVIVYGYSSENSARVFEDANGNTQTKVHEDNRTDESRSAQRYLKRIRYGNYSPFFPVLLDNAAWPEPPDATASDGSNSWHFEAVFDYGEHDKSTPMPHEPGAWPSRSDPFSSYRAGFEVRTYRLCQRVLMFHHFPEEPGMDKDCLVRSTDFTYSYEQGSETTPLYTFIQKVTQYGYKRNNGGYIKRSMPPVEFEYTKPKVQDMVEKVDSSSLKNLPIGVDGSTYQWTDLHGEGIPGVLTEQGDAWFYKRNLSPISSDRTVELAPMEPVDLRPNTNLAAGAQFMDLAGDGQPDLVVMEGPVSGLYEHDDAEGWHPFRPFTSRLSRNLNDPNTKLIDLTGDGHTDILVTEDEVFIWHPSRGEEGFAPANRVSMALDEEKGPRQVFGDATQSLYLADLSGDGLTDIVRIRNGEVCYWPNLGYCRFGPRISMDNAPLFDNPDQFNQKRIRLADIDGTGTTDIIYLHRDGVRLYFNQSGNSWGEPKILEIFPRVDDLANIVAADLLGNGTACLVWSSPLPGDSGHPMRYVNLMGEHKPHLLVKTRNNLGAETRVHYVPSTKFYLQDKYKGNPWITKLPFPVHVVERVETYDHISHNRFVSRYAYHHGYFDGEEREFRGFGMVEQWDTEEYAKLSATDALGEDTTGTNNDPASHVPPVLTRTWFHTGAYVMGDKISLQYLHEYYGAPNRTDPDYEKKLLEHEKTLLPDTILPDNLTAEESREACRALKGVMLRQEVYSNDDTDKAHIPYTVTEQNFSITRLQSRKTNRHAVFFTHPREVITYHYERNAGDPRVQHALTLDVDDFGNVLKEVAIGYGRLQPDASLPSQTDQDKQTKTLITYTENVVTNAIDDSIKNSDGSVRYPHQYRAPLPCETKTYELTGFKPKNKLDRFSFKKWTQDGFALANSAAEIQYEQTADDLTRQKRLIEHVRTLYRKDDLTTLLPLGELEPLALPGESYQLAFTPELARKIYVDSGKLSQAELNLVLAKEGGYVHTGGDNGWWIPSGRMFYSPDSGDSSAQELTEAATHFFIPRRYQDPFGIDSFVEYDRYDLLVQETRDALDNRVTAGEREQVMPNGSILPKKNGIDYRALQPCLMMDANRNRTEVAFDAMGMVVGTSVMGKPEENLGDSLEGFNPDLDEDVALDHLANPLMDPNAILSRASTRLVYDLFAYLRTKDRQNPHPVVVYTMARETHDSDLEDGQHSKIQHSFTYSDGFGREIQKKIQAEKGKVPQRDDKGGIKVGPDNQPEMSEEEVSPRWVGSGWTIFNNKGKPVRQYEPFFSDTHKPDFDAKIGVSPVVFYDPLERVVATLYPNHTYEKIIFDPWRQTSYDVNDTCAQPVQKPEEPPPRETGNPRTDPDIGGLVTNYFHSLPADPLQPWQTWYEQRISGAMGATEQKSAGKAAAHADTPSTAYFDTLGRPFLTMARNRVICPGHDQDGSEEWFATRVDLDIEGNQRAVRDAVKKAFDAQGNQVQDPLGRIVMRYDYDMAGPEESDEEGDEDEGQKPIHQISMEAGERWTLFNVADNPIRSWDSRGFARRMTYDELHRPTGLYVTENGIERLMEKTIYGEKQGDGANHRGQVYQQYDQAGVVTQEQYDFKGNPLQSSRQLQPEYKQAIDWKTTPPDGEIFSSSTTFDALNRPLTLTTPDKSITRHTYNEANLLDQIDVALHGATINGEPDWKPFVITIDYDAKGQRSRIDYGNGVSTSYAYDLRTFRLISLLTKRKAVEYPDDAPQHPLPDWPGKQVQNLHYTYDPAGNITHIRDKAQQTIFFRNKRVEPAAEYTYDALYRLIQATGREHLGQNKQTIPHSYDDALRTGLPQPGDGRALGTYIERYVYDEVGNFMEMQHRGTDPQHSGWTRYYTYNENSLTENDKKSNRLSSTQVGKEVTATPEPYTYDSHGNMLKMPQLQVMQWDCEDQLQMTRRQMVNIAEVYGEDEEGKIRQGERTYYVYDASGERVRKATLSANGNLKDERIYLGGFEIYRKYNGNGNTVMLERETLHVMDDQQRIALVESKTVDTNQDPSPKELIRYQIGNHLGSVSLELNQEGKVISYEEYSPYGSTVYQAVDKNIKAAAKRYRYTGKERDEESGLEYFGARYRVPCLAQWISVDPDEQHLSKSRYAYVSNRPTKLVDPDGMDEKKPEGVFDRYKREMRAYKRAQEIQRHIRQWEFDDLLDTKIQNWQSRNQKPGFLQRLGRSLRSRLFAKLIDVHGSFYGPTSPPSPPPPHELKTNIKIKGNGASRGCGTALGVLGVLVALLPTMPQGRLGHYIFDKRLFAQYLRLLPAGSVVNMATPIRDLPGIGWVNEQEPSESSFQYVWVKDEKNIWARVTLGQTGTREDAKNQIYHDIELWQRGKVLEDPGTTIQGRLIQRQGRQPIFIRSYKEKKK